MMEVVDRDDARASIIGGAHYFSRVLHKIPDRIGMPDRYWLASRRTTWASVISRTRASSRSRSERIPTAGTKFATASPLLGDEQWYRRVQRGYAPGKSRSATSTTSAATTRS